MGIEDMTVFVAFRATCQACQTRVKRVSLARVSVSPYIYRVVTRFCALPNFHKRGSTVFVAWREQ